MTDIRWSVLLVEDTARRAIELTAALTKSLKPRFSVQQLDTSQRGTGAYEDRLRAVLREPRYKELALVVTDRDLSTLPNYPGLSEAVISKVASELSIPACIYASGKTDSFLERLRSGGGRIILDATDPAAMAGKVRVLADGFRQIHELVDEIGQSKERRRALRGPATALADLLQATEVVDHLALYTRGDQRMIAGLTPLTSDAGTKAPRGERVRRIALALGMWLYESILRFPGVVLDRTAAASFLGIQPKAFETASVMKPFGAALYRGPFADSHDPRWWRHRLVELLHDGGVADGRLLVKKATGIAPAACKCAFDQKSPAGFVCVMTNVPVCDDHSVAQIGWLPRGADLARVRRDVFEEIGPWIGMS